MYKELFINEFFTDGRGPDLEKIIWNLNGTRIVGFEYYNPDPNYDENNLMHLKLLEPLAYSMAFVDIYKNSLATSESKAAIFQIEDSIWLGQFFTDQNPDHKHFQLIFYDEIFDVYCKNIIIGKGPLLEEDE